jgi:hypothetical protein
MSISASPAVPGINCKVCDRGVLVRKKRFRMSGPAVAIGFILLIPSVLGILFSAFILFAVAVGVGHDAGNPDVAGAAAIGTGIAIFIGVGCFVGGLLGWLLIMRKRVLQCNVCEAVVNAS